MASTNKTTNYGLSQFIGSDKPTWLQDYNGDMEKIDAGMEANKEAADNIDTNLSALQTTVADLTTTVTNQGTTISKHDGEILALQTTTDNLQDQITDNSNDISDIQENIGNISGDIWVILDSNNGIGTVDGTWKTSWIGYMMGYLNRSENNTYVATQNGAGFTSAGTGGTTFLGMAQQLNSNIQNKKAVKRVIIGDLVNDVGSNLTTYISTVLQFSNWVRTNWPNAKIEWCPYAWQWDASNRYSRGKWKQELIGQIGQTGIGLSESFHSATQNKNWYRSDNKFYNDKGMHEIGARMASYLNGQDFITSQPTLAYDIKTFPLLKGGIADWSTEPVRWYESITEKIIDGIWYLNIAITWVLSTPPSSTLWFTPDNWPFIYANPFRLSPASDYLEPQTKLPIMVQLNALSTLTTGILGFNAAHNTTPEGGYIVGIVGELNTATRMYIHTVTDDPIIFPYF